MEHYLQNPESVAAHGRESRKLAEQVFDVRLVNALILREMGLEQCTADERLTATRVALTA